MNARIEAVFPTARPSLEVLQTGGEFTLIPETQTIVNLCSLRQLHVVDEADEKLAAWCDLSERQIDWVRTAKAGDDEEGYAEALLGIDEEGWFPLRARASSVEASLLDGEGG